MEQYNTKSYLFSPKNLHENDLRTKEIKLKYKTKKGKKEIVGKVTYSIKRTLPVVGDVWFAFCWLFEDPFMTLI